MKREFWTGKRVLLTGHTGFKGSWMSLVLSRLGAKVHGIALPPEGQPNLHELLVPWSEIASEIVDIRDRNRLTAAVRRAAPDIVLHFAAQSLVRRSYTIPIETFDTNVMGSLYLLDALAGLERKPPVLAITSDKVYRNDESGVPFRELAPLGGDDPYSASKAACEIAMHSVAGSRGIRIATARAGNVVGGGDFAEDGLIPDAVRAIRDGRSLQLRRPMATRPWQHVLDVVRAYLTYAEMIATSGTSVPSALNIGPVGRSLTVREVVASFYRAMGREATTDLATADDMPEKNNLELDSSLAHRTLGRQQS